MRTNIHGIEIGYDSYGEGDATLVLLHAFPLNRQQWREQGEALSRASGVRVIAPDLRGFGESSLEVGPTTMEQMAGDIVDLIGVLHIDRFILGGLSMGGYVTFQCLRQFPERIQGVILADTKAAADTPEQRAARETTAVFAEQNGAGKLLDRDAPRLFSQYTAAKLPQVIERAREIAALNSDIGVAAASRGMALRGDSTDLLPQIRVPTLIIVGEQDAITPIAEARTLFERIPEAQLELITDAGHLSNLEQSHAFSGAVARFLDNRLDLPLTPN